MQTGINISHLILIHHPIVSIIYYYNIKFDKCVCILEMLHLNV